MLADVIDLRRPAVLYLMRNKAACRRRAKPMHWWNRCDNGLIVHQKDPGKNVTQVIFAKVREIGVGRLTILREQAAAGVAL